MTPVLVRVPMPPLCDVLRHLCRYRGMSMGDVARIMGTTVVAVSQYERGRVPRAPVFEARYLAALATAGRIEEP